MLADNNQLGRRLAIEGEGDLIEAVLASLSTRAGRFLSRSKEMLQRLRTCGGGGGGGVVMVTDVLAVACLPRSSTTLQVTLMVPGDAPVVLRVAVDVLLAIWPEEAE